MVVRVVIQVSNIHKHLPTLIHPSYSHTYYSRTTSNVTTEQAYEYVNFNGGMTLASDYEYTSGEKGVTGTYVDYGAPPYYIISLQQLLYL
jgi:hypothetical protein